MSLPTIELVEAVADQSLARPLFAPEGTDARSALTRGFTFRQAWPRKHNGTVNLTLNQFFNIRPDWQVFVSAGEAIALGDATAGSFIGAAKFTVHGVSAGVNVVTIQLSVEWGTPCSIITDYLVVPV